MATKRTHPLKALAELDTEERRELRQQAYNRTLRLHEGNFDQVNTFRLNVDKRYPKTCYLFLSLAEGKIHILSGGTMLKDHYTAADNAESERLANEPALVHGMGVGVGGSVYRVVVNGDYSDAGYLEYVGSM